VSQGTLWFLGFYLGDQGFDGDLGFKVRVVNFQVLHNLPPPFLSLSDVLILGKL